MLCSNNVEMYSPRAMKKCQALTLGLLNMKLKHIQM